MTLEIFRFITIFTACTFFLLGLFVFSRGTQSRLYSTFFLFNLLVALWSLGFFFTMWKEIPYGIAVICSRLSHLFGSLSPLAFYSFVILFLGTKNPSSIYQSHYIFAATVAVMCLTPYVVRGLEPKLFYPYYPKPGWFYLIFVGNYAYYFSRAFWLLIREYRKSSTNALKKNQIRYVLIAVLIGWVSVATLFAPIYDIEITPLLIFLPLYSIITTYAIVRHKLLDIRVVITRTSVFLAVYALLLGMPLAGALIGQLWLEARLGQRWWVWLWVVVAILSTAAHYVNLYFQKRAEDRLLRAQRRYQQTLLQASHGMTRIRVLQRLLGLIVHVVTKAVGLTHAAVFLHDEKGQSYACREVRNRQFCDPNAKLETHDALIELLKDEQEPIVRDEIEAQVGDGRATDPESLRNAQAVAQMRGIQASVVIPSFMQDELTGFLVLGAKRSGKPFTDEDLAVFSTLTNQAAVAVENARFYEEERQRQAALFHAASLASLGTMASSMGHQVNNRFNVVSVVASTEKLKLKELLEKNPIDPEVMRKALGDCLAQFDSLVEEAMKGGQIVSAIRRIARPSPDGHKPLALAAAIQAGVDVAQYKVRFADLDFKIDLPADLPKIQGDLSQLGEVFLNLLDNANDAIKMRGEPRPGEPAKERGRITVTAQVVREAGERFVEVQVADNGLGMTEKEQERLFVPFFTTKATAEKGTGLGLYVIKKIVESHRGTIATRSMVGKGTAFSIRLPVAVDAEQPASQ